mmetsp:Transcript_140307/g.391174  ORF Transcript_140307/g.391174 Transcript_140307/m.391174 type:complete len:310 (+) Transcript_140307:53-982(+)
MCWLLRCMARYGWATGIFRAASEQLAGLLLSGTERSHRKSLLGSAHCLGGSCGCLLLSQERRVQQDPNSLRSVLIREASLGIREHRPALHQGRAWSSDAVSPVEVKVVEGDPGGDLRVLLQPHCDFACTALAPDDGRVAPLQLRPHRQDPRHVPELRQVLAAECHTDGVPHGLGAPPLRGEHDGSPSLLDNAAQVAECGCAEVALAHPLANRQGNPIDDDRLHAAGRQEHPIDVEEDNPRPVLWWELRPLPLDSCSLASRVPLRVWWGQEVVEPAKGLLGNRPRLLPWLIGVRRHAACNKPLRSMGART